MSTVSKTIDENLELTELSWNGKLSLDEIIQTLNEFYASPTRNLIWNISKADISTITNDDLKTVIAITKEPAHRRPDGKTAILGSTDLHFGMARVYATYCEFENHPISVSVFRNKDAAINWISNGT